MNLVSPNEIMGDSEPKRRVSIRFIPSSPAYVQVTLRQTPSVSAPGSSSLRRQVAEAGSRTDKPSSIGFYLEAPAACGVKLAADFTQWDKSPLEMTRLGHGLWRVIIPLPPGRYSYRFIVDGQWCDDLHSLETLTNVAVTTVP